MNELRSDKKPGGWRRRSLLLAAGLGGAGLLLGVALRPPTARDRLGKPGQHQPQGQLALNAWVRLTPQDEVIVVVPRVEMGQGAHSALAMLVAEELDADWARVRVEQAPVDAIYSNTAVLLNMLPVLSDDDSWTAQLSRAAAQGLGQRLQLQLTGGSTSVRDAWEPMRLAGATARAMLLDAAAKRWQVPVAELRVKQGQVLHAASARAARFGELAEAAIQQSPRSEVKLKSAEQFVLIGKPVPRLDLADKSSGRARYGIDMRPEGLIHAAIRQCPVFGGKLRRFDAAAVRQRPGVIDVLPVGDNAVAVLADSHWRAQQAVDALTVEFDEGEAAALDSGKIRQQLLDALQQSGSGFRSIGDAPAQLKQAGRTIEALYEVPFLAHTAMEPINCTAQFRDGHLTLWCGTQVPDLARWRAAAVAGIAREQVELHVPLLGGGFGRRLELDMVEQAVSLALRAQGRPVQLLWSREEDIQHDMYRPTALARFEASLDEQGRPQAWLNQVAAPSIGLSTMERLLPSMAADMPDKNQIEGAFDLPYAIPHLSVRQHRVRTPVPIGSWRSVGHSYNAFFTECFIDELAHAAGQDPFAYRRALLTHKPRHKQVLELAAEKAGWGQALPAGRARGIALHESFGSWCAQVAEVSIEQGQPRVHRVVCAFDCGLVVNPDGVEAQLQSAIVYGLSAALYGAITLSKGRVEQRNFPDYEAVRMAQMPRIEVHLVRSAEAPGGAGEPGTPPIAPAVANALFVLTGKRLRQLPLRLA